MANDDPPEVDLEELHECAVCSATTTSRCSACKEVFFCSKDHQRLLWFTHKYLCGRDSSVFFCAGLFSNEYFALLKVPNEPYKLEFGARPGETLLGYFGRKGWFDGSLQDLIGGIGDLTPTIPEPRRSLLLIHTRNYLVGSSVFPTLGNSAWRLLSSTAAQYSASMADIDPDVPEGDNFLRVFNPYLRAKLILTSLTQSHDEGYRRMPGYDHSMLDLGQKRLIRVVGELPIGPGAKFALHALDASNFAALQSRKGFRDVPGIDG